MGILNKNNFLIWTGGFNNAPPLVVANNDTPQIKITDTQVEFYPMANDQATFGFNYASFEFTVQDYPGNPAVYDPVDHKVTYYKRPGVVVGDVLVLKYKFQDLLGNISNEGTISILVVLGPTGWRGHYPQVCLLDVDTDENTGYAFFEQLERYYLANNSVVLPLQLKDNVDGDVDFIPKNYDNIQCPLPTSNLLLQIFQNLLGNVITRIKLVNNTSLLSQDFTGLLYVDDSASQPYQLYIDPGPPGSTFDVSITYDGPPMLPQAGTCTITPAVGGSLALTNVIPATTLTDQVTAFLGITFGSSVAGTIVME